MIKWVREEEKMWQQSLKMTRLNRTFSVNKVERAPTKVLRCLPPMSISSPWIHTGKMIILLQANNLKWRKRMIHQQANLLNEKWKNRVCTNVSYFWFICCNRNAIAICIWENILQLVHISANAIGWTNTECLQLCQTPLFSPLQGAQCVPVQL